MRGVLLAVVVAAASLVASSAPAAAQIGSAQIPACPSEPIQVVRSRGGVIDHLGSVPGIPDLCQQVRSDDTGTYYYGSWRSDWPGAGDAYPAIKAAVNGVQGTRTEFVTRSYPGMQWVDSYVNEGLEPMVIDGVTYTTLRLAHERKGIEGNTYHSIITVWRDVRTGVSLRAHEQQISGQSYGPDTTWQAVRVIALPPVS